MNRWIKGLSVCVLFSMSSCKPPPKAESPPVRVEAEYAIQRDVRDFIEAIGNVYEYTLVQIRPQVEGILQRVYVSEGDFVKNGDLLFQIDSRPFKQALDEAEATLARDKASLELAKSTVNRYKEAATKDFIAPLNYEQYLANLASAEAQIAFDLAAVEIARINLDYCTIYAPITGRIGLYNVNVGNLVVNDDPNFLIEIRQIRPVDIRFYVPQRDFQEVQRDQNTLDIATEVYLPYESNRKFEGSLYFIDNHVDLQTGMVLLKAVVENDELKLWPGEFVRVRLYTKTIKDATVVPYSALQLGQKGYYVFKILPDKTAEMVPVKIGTKRESGVVITSGIKPGDLVVTNGQVNLKTGSKVAIVGQKEKEVPPK